MFLIAAHLLLQLIIHAGDFAWWQVNHSEVPRNIDKWTCSPSAAKRFKLNLHTPQVKGGYNSGSRAIQFAIEKGAKKILLLGYDCSVKKGIHWHGPHENRLLSNPSPARCKQWAKQFHQVAGIANNKKVSVINCSRFTALTCFEKSQITQVL